MTAPVPPSAASDVDQRGSSRKRTAILEAATTLFLRNGYLGTSMDEIARLAAVSKQTVYKHFADKQRLFFEIVTSTLDDASGSVYSEVLELQDSGDLEADLQELARRQLALVMQPQIIQLRRLVIGEAGRFPELGRSLLRARSRAHDRRPSHHLRTARRARNPATRRPDPRRCTLQLADHVDPAKPGNAARPRRASSCHRTRPLGRRRRARVPRRLRQTLTTFTRPTTRTSSPPERNAAGTAKRVSRRRTTSDPQLGHHQSPGQAGERPAVRRIPTLPALARDARAARNAGVDRGRDQGWVRLLHAEAAGGRRMHSHATGAMWRAAVLEVHPSSRLRRMAKRHTNAVVPAARVLVGVKLHPVAP